MGGRTKSKHITKDYCKRNIHKSNGKAKVCENDKKFISESIGSARWLIKAVEQRNLTTLKISSEIVKQQKCSLKKEFL